MREFLEQRRVILAFNCRREACASKQLRRLCRVQAVSQHAPRFLRIRSLDQDLVERGVQSTREDGIRLEGAPWECLRKRQRLVKEPGGIARRLNGQDFALRGGQAAGVRDAMCVHCACGAPHVVVADALPLGVVCLMGEFESIDAAVHLLGEITACVRLVAEPQRDEHLLHVIYDLLQLAGSCSLIAQRNVLGVSEAFHSSDVVCEQQ
mmetsp:Transcript_51956/g.104094  ORF Transcript_51956/g.104094 Transcript_51956/m.104094 type:complete len:208 (-) Transcript_51956:578-1201(-)